MTNYPSFAHAAATQNCQASYLNWQISKSEKDWQQYQMGCKIYRIVTGNEFKPVLWQEAK